MADVVGAIWAVMKMFELKCSEEGLQGKVTSARLFVFNFQFLI